MGLSGHASGEYVVSSLSSKAKRFHHCLSGTFLCPVNVMATFCFVFLSCAAKRCHHIGNFMIISVHFSGKVKILSSEFKMMNNDE